MSLWPFRRKPCTDAADQSGSTIIGFVLDCKGPEFCERERQRVAALAAEVVRLAAENEHLSSQLGDGLK